MFCPGYLLMKQITIHTDGGCEGNPGPGGWAAVLRCGDAVSEVSGGTPATTNNRMELQAAIGALTALKEPHAIQFFTDSEYVRNGIVAWLHSWKARGWRTADQKPVRNEDLWRQLDMLASTHIIQWHWLKGHAGHADNERCDRLAAEEMEKIRKQFTRAQLAALRDEFQRARTPKATQSELL